MICNWWNNSESKLRQFSSINSSSSLVDSPLIVADSILIPDPDDGAKLSRRRPKHVMLNPPSPLSVLLGILSTIHRSRQIRLMWWKDRRATWPIDTAH